MVTRRPVGHDGMAGEEGVLGELRLLGLGLELDELPSQDDVGAARVLGVVVHLVAVAALNIKSVLDIDTFIQKATKIMQNVIS